MKMINKIVIGLVITGFSFLVLGFSLGARNQIRTMYDNRELNFGWTNQRNSEYYDVSEEFTEIENLYIDIEAFNIRIEEYSGNSIKVEGTVSTNTVINKNGSTLEINEKKSFTSNWSFGFDLYNDKLIIYVPEGMFFNKININVGTGDVKMMGTLEAKEIKMDVDMGNIQADSIICEEAILDAGFGNISITLLDSQNSDFNVNMGTLDAQLIGREEEYSYDVICNMGEVTIGSYRSGEISSRDSGGSGLRYINAKCDLGSINIIMKGR